MINGIPGAILFKDGIIKGNKYGAIVKIAPTFEGAF